MTPAKQKTRIEDIADKSIIDAIIASNGTVQVVAALLNTYRSDLDRRIKSNETLSAALHDAQERNLDMAETKLLDKVKEGNLEAIKYYLSHKAKSRGYDDTPQNVSTNVTQIALKSDAEIDRIISLGVNNDTRGTKRIQ